MGKKHQSRLKTGLAFATMLASCCALAETHYQWRNERGTLIHSDRPPPAGVDYEVVSSDSDFKRVVSAKEGVVPLETEPRVGNEFEQVDRTPDDTEGKNPVMCERASRYLQTLTETDTPSVRDEAGDLRPLSAEEIATEQAKAEKLIEANCQ